MRALLADTTDLAVVGLSPKPHRTSYQVSAYMQRAGYAITPVHPRCMDVLGEVCHPDLTAAAVAGPIGIVNVFRRSADVPPVVDEAIAVGARAIWMQRGIAHPEAAEAARASGIPVVMDRCIKVEHARLFGG